MVVLRFIDKLFSLCQDQLIICKSCVKVLTVSWVLCTLGLILYTLISHLIRSHFSEIFWFKWSISRLLVSHLIFKMLHLIQQILSICTHLNRGSLSWCCVNICILFHLFLRLKTSKKVWLFTNYFNWVNMLKFIPFRVKS